MRDKTIVHTTHMEAGVNPKKIDTKRFSFPSVFDKAAPPRNLRFAPVANLKKHAKKVIDCVEKREKNDRAHNITWSFFNDRSDIP